MPPWPSFKNSIYALQLPSQSGLGALRATRNIKITIGVCLQDNTIHHFFGKEQTEKLNRRKNSMGLSIVFLRSGPSRWTSGSSAGVSWGHGIFGIFWGIFDTKLAPISLLPYLACDERSEATTLFHCFFFLWSFSCWILEVGTNHYGCYLSRFLI